MAFGICWLLAVFGFWQPFVSAAVSGFWVLVAFVPWVAFGFSGRLASLAAFRVQKEGRKEERMVGGSRRKGRKEGRTEEGKGAREEGRKE